MLGGIAQAHREAVADAETVAPKHVGELGGSPIELPPRNRALAAVLGGKDDGHVVGMLLRHEVDLGPVRDAVLGHDAHAPTSIPR